MGNFSGRFRNKGNGGFISGGSGGGMHPAVCSKCGKECEVPFKPSGGKPVYCQFCFSKQQAVGRVSSGRRDSGGGGNFSRGGAVMHQAICVQCGESCQVPFKPSGDKPVYCDACFGRKREYGRDERMRQADSGDQSRDALNSINGKLDKILELLKRDEAKPFFPESKNEDSGVINEAAVVDGKRDKKEKVVKKVWSKKKTSAQNIIVVKPSAKKKKR